MKKVRVLTAEEAALLVNDGDTIATGGFGLSGFSKTMGRICYYAVPLIMCGLSVGILWPGSFSIASSELPRGGTAMFALLALAGDFGCTSGPTLVGLAADAFDGNLQIGIGFGIIFPIVLIICANILRLKKKRGSLLR